MADLDERFRQAVEEVQGLPDRPDNDALLRLYGFYKQATEGDVTGRRPGMLDVKGRAKWDAWKRLEGMPADEARESYIELVDELQESSGR